MGGVEFLVINMYWVAITVEQILARCFVLQVVLLKGTIACIKFIACVSCG